MKLQFTGIVREIKDWDHDREGNVLPPEKVTSQITFLDRGTGGDVVITYPLGHGFVLGGDVDIKVDVKPAIRNYRLQLYAVLNHPEPASPPKK